MGNYDYPEGGPEAFLSRGRYNQGMGINNYSSQIKGDYDYYRNMNQGNEVLRSNINNRDNLYPYHENIRKSNYTFTPFTKNTFSDEKRGIQDDFEIGPKDSKYKDLMNKNSNEASQLRAQHSSSRPVASKITKLQSRQDLNIRESSYNKDGTLRTSTYKFSDRSKNINLNLDLMGNNNYMMRNRNNYDPDINIYYEAQKQRGGNFGRDQLLYNYGEERGNTKFYTQYGNLNPPQTGGYESRLKQTSYKNYNNNYNKSYDDGDVDILSQFNAYNFAPKDLRPKRISANHVPSRITNTTLKNQTYQNVERITSDSRKQFTPDRVTISSTMSRAGDKIYEVETLISDVQFSELPYKKQNKKLIIGDKVSRDLFYYINEVRKNPANYVEKLEEGKKNIKKLTNGNIYYEAGDDIKIGLKRGEQAFDEAIRELKNLKKMKPLKFSRKLTVKQQDNQEEESDREYLRNKIKELNDQGLCVYSFWQEFVNNPEVAVLLMIADDNRREEKHKRKDLLDKNMKYIGISSSEKKENGVNSFITLSPGNLNPKN